ncbi:hypothetical protein AB0B25_22930 [Nocardia sp. NPDC049190]|uniref:hypothetical protein n=2 Tax=unclassified Nocardia TaxID=2637762 RepID=UPI0033D572AC
MPHSRWISRSTLLIAGVFAAAALTACGSDSSPAPTTSSSSTTASATGMPGATSAPPASPDVSDASATQLCDMLRPELSNWRIQGGTLGKIGLNALVHEWALRNGGINGAVLADKAMIDRAAIKMCPDVRQQAIEALGIPDLASGLAF